MPIRINKLNSCLTQVSQHLLMSYSYTFLKCEQLLSIHIPIANLKEERIGKACRVTQIFS